MKKRSPQTRFLSILAILTAVALFGVPPSGQAEDGMGFFGEKRSGLLGGVAPDGKHTFSEPMQTKDGFGAQLWVSDSEQAFTSLLTADTRGKSSITGAPRNHPIYVAIMFVDPGTRRVEDNDRPGSFILKSDITFDYEVLKPDGTFYGKEKGMVVWEGAAPTAHIIHMGRRRMNITFEMIDPVGEYTINVTVHDRVRKIDISLSRKIALQE